MVPPGILYLARALPVAFLRSAVTYVVFARLPQLLTQLQNIDTVDKLPERILVSLTRLQSSGIVERLLGYVQTGPIARWLPGPIGAALLVQPIFFALRSIYLRVSTWQDKRRLGAVDIPLVPDRWPGGLGNVSKLGKMLDSGYPADSFQSWFNEYGNTIMLNLLFENRIVTVEPDYIKAVLATEFDNYWKGPVDHDRGISLLGTGVFNTDDEMWKFHRSMTRPFFSRERISDFDIFDKHANDAIDQAATRLGQGYAVDIQDVASRFTLDSATEFLFGKSVDSLSAGLAYPESASGLTPSSFRNHPSNAFVHAFIEGQRVHVDRSRFGSKWRLNEFWKDLVTPHREVIDQFIEPILNDALAKKAEGQESKQEADTLLGHLLLGTDDKRIIRDEILNILVAGRDTTSATISFAVYMLAQHPEMAKRLRSEVLEKIGSSRRPTHEDMKTMPYLRAFINETLRLYPAVPVDARTSKKATTWATHTGPLFYVPANTKIIYAVFYMHRRTDLWGPDALEFDPDRFMDERLRKYLTPNPYIFLPFNAGPRICLGQQFAYQETSFFLVRLLQRFASFSLAPDAQPEHTKPPASWKSSPMKAKEQITFGASLTMYARGGLWVRMTEAIRRE
ncbi:cytochrome P450 monooxygenase pc-2 [Mycena alexandri]|uniref:Cytochrome P450 monooxygenase pc-2 n=1 Tax=Mycena alexandri TaxID=1745969 RepID=A0AAD6TLQ7_9AGAR|nr:cytochrome P450 monooxygenase pc-2 [Mycena alexandri]